MRSFFIIAGLLLYSLTTFADLAIPSNMSPADQITALEILGYGSASKILGDPYPLGGYSGVEVSISNEILSTIDIARLGNATTGQADTSFYIFNIGKGLYNNVDIYFQFTFLGQQENIANYGAQVRWSFFQAQYLPIYMTLVLHGNDTNYQNLILTGAQGVDLVAGFKEGNVTLFAGVGTIRSEGTFSGGSGGVTSSGETTQLLITSNRYLAGTNFKFGNTFFALELDHCTAPVYSAKVGFRY